MLQIYSLNHFSHLCLHRTMNSWWWLFLIEFTSYLSDFIPITTQYDLNIFQMNVKIVFVREKQYIFHYVEIGWRLSNARIEYNAYIDNVKCTATWYKFIPMSKSHQMKIPGVQRCCCCCCCLFSFCQQKSYKVTWAINIWEELSSNKYEMFK